MFYKQLKQAVDSSTRIKAPVAIQLNGLAIDDIAYIIYGFYEGHIDMRKRTDNMWRLKGWRGGTTVGDFDWELDVVVGY